MEAVTEVADCAGQLILEVYATEFDIFFKKDASPVTVADERAKHSFSGTYVIFCQVYRRLGKKRFQMDWWSHQKATHFG